MARVSGSFTVGVADQEGDFVSETQCHYALLCYDLAGVKNIPND